MVEFYVVIKLTMITECDDHAVNDYQSSWQYFETKDDAIKNFQNLSWSKEEPVKFNNVYLYRIFDDGLATTKQLLSTHFRWGYNPEQSIELVDKCVDKIIEEVLKGKIKNEW